jgi:RNA polymerase primary sigma factor
MNNMAIIDFVEDDCYKSPFEQATNSMLRKELETALDGIEQRAAEVIRCRYGLGDTVPMTLKEIGARYNLSRERVRQIEKRGLLMLQHSYNSCNLENYIA